MIFQIQCINPIRRLCRLAPPPAHNSDHRCPPPVKNVVTTGGNLLPVSKSASCEAGTVERSNVTLKSIRSDAAEVPRRNRQEWRRLLDIDGANADLGLTPPQLVHRANNGCGDAHWSRCHASFHLCQLFSAAFPFIASCKSAWRSCIQSLRSSGTRVGMGGIVSPPWAGESLCLTLGRSSMSPLSSRTSASRSPFAAGTELDSRTLRHARSRRRVGSGNEGHGGVRDELRSPEHRSQAAGAIASWPSPDETLCG